MSSEIFWITLKYVINAPFFWGSMGFTVAIAMFAGVLLYDGQMNQVKKGAISVLSYASTIFWVTVSRILETTGSPGYKTYNPEYAYAGIMTLVLITLSWMLGITLGVRVFKYIYRGKPVNKY